MLILCYISKFTKLHYPPALLHKQGTVQIHTCTSTIADARHQEENPMRKKCLKAIVQEGHNICTSEWEMLSAILKIKANTV